MKKTEHYQLNQYEPQDSFLRTDFNEDNAKIDLALSTKSQVVLGSYVGDGTETRHITLGFPPKAVLMCTDNGFFGQASGSGYVFGGLAMPGKPLKWRTTELVMEVTATGFQLYHGNYHQVNAKDYHYYYIVIR